MTASAQHRRSVWDMREPLLDTPSGFVELLIRGSECSLWRRIVRDRTGSQLLARRPVFDRSASDPHVLLALPEGSFGRDYGLWMQRERIRPSRVGASTNEVDSDLAFLRLRLVQVHDLWHVLTGFGRDPLGELGMLTFAWAQMPTWATTKSLARLVRREIAETGEHGRGTSAILLYLWRAYRGGRRAQFLAPLVLEDFFLQPTETLRRIFRIQPPPIPPRLAS